MEGSVYKMTALVLNTKTFLQDLLVGWSLATGKIKDSYKKVSHIAERIGTARAASHLASMGHYEIAKSLMAYNEKEGK